MKRRLDLFVDEDSEFGMRPDHPVDPDYVALGLPSWESTTSPGRRFQTDLVNSRKGA